MSRSQMAREINAAMDELLAAGELSRPLVFLSYAHPDVGLVEKLAEHLEAHGFKAWWDGQIEIGAEFEARIEQLLDAAVAVIVLWSDHAIRSDWVKWEAHQGAKREKLVPVVVEGFDVRDIRPPFNALNTLPLASHDRLIAEVRRLARRS